MKVLQAAMKATTVVLTSRLQQHLILFYPWQGVCCNIQLECFSPLRMKLLYLAKRKSLQISPSLNAWQIFAFARTTCSMQLMSYGLDSLHSLILDAPRRRCNGKRRRCRRTRSTRRVAVAVESASSPSNAPRRRCRCRQTRSTRRAAVKRAASPSNVPACCRCPRTRWLEKRVAVAVERVTVAVDERVAVKRAPVA